jgi:hypothetical protein
MDKLQNFGMSMLKIVHFFTLQENNVHSLGLANTIQIMFAGF